MKKSHLTYEELLRLTSYGIFAMNFKGISVHDKRLNDCKCIKNADYKGIYVGSPGRDIYHMFPYLDNKQMNEIVDMVVEKFPKIPPGNHVNVGAFIRFVYGQFEKQGVLRSEKDFKRMKKEKLDWKSSRIFLELLYVKLQKDDNFYGMSILCEMNAHRIGDEAIINKDKNKLKKMEKEYNKSVGYAHKCKSYKQLFTPYYWASQYFSKFKYVKKALFYSYLTVDAAEQYCPDARPGYIDKILDCVLYIKKHDEQGWKIFYNNYSKNAENKCVKKVLKKIK